MKTNTMCLFYNIAVLTGWVALAIVFNHWWIALFSLLFVSFPKVVHAYHRICDGCGARSPYADTEKHALKLAKDAGWKHIEFNNTDYCPCCQAKEAN